MQNPSTRATGRILPLLIAFVLAAGALVVVGCGGDKKSESNADQADTPAAPATPSTTTPDEPTGNAPVSPDEQAARDAITRSLTALVDGDSKVACASFTRSYAKERYGSTCERDLAKASKQLRPFIVDDSIEITEVAIDGDKASAILVFRVQNPQSKEETTMRTTFDLVKQKGKWKINDDDGGKQI